MTRPARYRLMACLLPLSLVFIASAQTTEEIEDAAGGPRPKLQRITAMTRSPVARPRADAPIPLEIEFNHEGTKLLRGPLRIDLILEGRALAHLETPEVVLPAGRQVVRLMLPPIEAEYIEQTVQARIRLIGEEGIIEFEQQLIDTPVAGYRHLAIGVVDPFQSAESRTFDLAAALSLEKFRPGNADRTLLTLPNRLEPHRLTGSPMSYLPYDVIFLAPDGLAQATEKQLDALRAWVEAGGSTVVLLGGGLAHRHAAFLNALADHQPQAPQFLLSERGHIDTADVPPADGIIMLRPGLGRALVLLGEDPLRFISSPHWPAAIAHIWKVRHSQVMQMATTGQWRTDQEKVPQDPRYRTLWGGRGAQPTPIPGHLIYSPRREMVGGHIVSALMPPSVRVIPFAVIVLILVLFTLAVGPGDYLLLGLLRQRKFTWVLFPAVAIAFTLLTVAVADAYMGRTDRRRALLLHEVGSDGRILKRTEFAQVFLAKERTVTEQVEGGLLLPVRASAGAGQTMRGFGGMPDDVTDRRTPPVFRGRLLERCEVSHRVFQWVPQMVRRTQIFLPDDPAAAPKHAIDWSAVDPARTDTVDTEKLLGPLSEEACILAFQGTQMQPLHGNVNALASQLSGQGVSFDQTLQQLSSRPQEGFFSVVAQISPAGGERFEDLTLLDPTDPDQWLLVIVIADEGNLHVYRRLYRKTDSTFNAQGPSDLNVGR